MTVTIKKQKYQLHLHFYNGSFLLLWFQYRTVCLSVRLSMSVSLYFDIQFVHRSRVENSIMDLFLFELNLSLHVRQFDKSLVISCCKLTQRSKNEACEMCKLLF